MDDFTTSTIVSAIFPHCKTTFLVHSYDVNYKGLLIVVVESGASRLQTYATRDELRELGEMLLHHANANEVMEIA